MLIFNQLNGTRIQQPQDQRHHCDQLTYEEAELCQSFSNKMTDDLNQQKSFARPLEVKFVLPVSVPKLFWIYWLRFSSFFLSTLTPNRLLNGRFLKKESFSGSRIQTQDLSALTKPC